MISFVEGEPALKINDSLVISDLHIGFEKKLVKQGYNVPSQTKNLLNKVLALQRRTNTKELIILGDVKEDYKRITREEAKQVPIFLRKCSEAFNKIIITKGNHDSLLEKISDFNKVVIVKEHVMKTSEGSIGFFHGHSWPSPEIITGCETLVIGHTHPSYSYTDHLSRRVTLPAWVISEVKQRELSKEYPFKVNKKISVKRVIVTPAFNDFFAGSTEQIGPITRYFKNEQVLLLDLTKVV